MNIRNRSLHTIHEDPLHNFILRRYSLNTNKLDASTNYFVLGSDVDQQFIEVIHQAFSEEYDFPLETLKSFPKDQIVHYLSKTHEFYLTTMIPEIEQQFVQLIQEEGIQYSIILNLYKDFDQYRTELESHILFEEETLFPQILRNENPAKCLVNSILEAAHHQHENDLALILESLISRAHSFKGQMPYFILIEKLLLLNKDLLIHARIEDDVLLS